MGSSWFRIQNTSTAMTYVRSSPSATSGANRVAQVGGKHYAIALDDYAGSSGYYQIYRFFFPGSSTFTTGLPRNQMYTGYSYYSQEQYYSPSYNWIQNSSTKIMLSQVGHMLHVEFPSIIEVNGQSKFTINVEEKPVGSSTWSASYSSAVTGIDQSQFEPNMTQIDIYYPSNGTWYQSTSDTTMTRTLPSIDIIGLTNYFGLQNMDGKTFRVCFINQLTSERLYSNELIFKGAPIIYYKTSGAFTATQPYYYDGTAFQQVSEIYYYNGVNWERGGSS